MRDILAIKSQNLICYNPYCKFIFKSFFYACPDSLNPCGYLQTLSPQKDQGLKL